MQLHELFPRGGPPHKRRRGWKQARPIIDLTKTQWHHDRQTLGRRRARACETAVEVFKWLMATTVGAVITALVTKLL